MENLRDIYALKAISQIPRILGNQDRNQFSPTYGCFHRDYWLDKTSDFPDAVRQFGVQSLALVYKHDFPGNIYKGKEKVRNWAIAGMKFWASIQHRDGSFDEFYPFERGWVGPTAFTMFTVIASLKLLKDEMEKDDIATITAAIKKAAYFIRAGESEEDHLANHHAMACMAVWKAQVLLNDKNLKDAYERLWKGFLTYHNADEGWSREYDGIDPGYLSATVSFLGKIYQENRDPRILEVVKKSIECCSYFAYPNGFYAGSLGSRNTLHFYSHGFEVFAKEVPLAAAVAEKMLKGLSEDKLVPPEIMSDRYLFYRVPEFLQAYLDYTPRPEQLEKLPCEREPFYTYLPQARIWAKKTPHYYAIANLAKGGVLKVFDLASGQLKCNDCGMIGELDSGKVVTTQWVDPSYECSVTEAGWKVTGFMNIVPSNKLFTPIKNIIFRVILVLTGWSPALGHLIKGRIRKMLMLGNRRESVRFTRTIECKNNGIVLSDKLELSGAAKFRKLSAGDEFFVRYVPQSRYFQSQELEIAGENLNGNAVNALNTSNQVYRMVEISI